ncbi:DNRLRE domain-containing protein [Rubritalea tangerina]|uniref:DNRLRE domain-containing protein n=1 Tax=Rubritalea tangerina TaxID=430798 RepID=A0ABW4ZBT3_9BACT
MKATLLSIFTSGAIICASSAATITTATFDTDTYLYFGTSNAFDPQITIGASQRPGSGHFNFGVLEFDVSTLDAGTKSLNLSAVQYVTNIPNPAGPPTAVTSTTGNATVHVVALNDSFSNYQLAPDKIAWYDTYVQSGSATVLGTYNFANQQTLSIDVTSTVDAWQSNPSNNHGFAIFSTSGNVELASSTYGNSSLVPSISVTPASVPEPSSMALLGLGGLALILRKRR